ncbi:zinc finger protein 79-like [Phyllopteryx taeniolatus]|uniref:zinc finger protein 79-like n=1 Tax=Phyllopteryx taeniolatus TaxID=161469 RepID=UPI002AD32A01|nr:zinc finger protein 79-like [Phyllopteryx taeniolatus]XP_061625164.1 zinc finger protein 79-like [Phyllopteryx taeniolatus]XP_061625165.1 zinc finger protein 79-like [Phyllopteryx taeniolatus]
MLKELVRERLIAAADEIFGLFEGTIASYEEQLCRAREETERHRRQLEAVCKTQIVVRLEDIEQLIGRQEDLAPEPQWGSSSLEEDYLKPTHVKEEEEEAGVCKLPLNGVSMESEAYENQPPEWSQFSHHSPSGDHCGGPPPDDLLALLSHSDDEEPLRSDTDCEDVQQLIGRQEELSPQPLWGISSLELEHLQHPHFEEEGEEADVSKLPLAGVSVKSEEEKDEPPEWSQLCHHSPSGDHCGGQPQDSLLAPMSDSDDTEEPLESDADCEGDDNPSKRSQKDATPNKKSSRKRQKCHALKEHFSCSVCGKAFTCKSHWMRHKKTHTGEKSFCCSVCGKTFSRKEHVELHMRTHTGEKPFRCSVCGTRFSVKQSMKKHMRTHTGEKPFSCSFCGTKFSRNESLEKHMRVHTGEKPFSCSVCGGRFAQRSNMTRHMQIHKKE